MRKFNYIILIASMFLLMLSINLFSQPAMKARERVDQIKKVKLLDLLNLDETQSANFLNKFNQYEKKISEKRNEMDELSRDMRKNLKKKASKEELNNMSIKLVQMQVNFFELIKEKIMGMKSLLNDEQYAKYLIFENEFPKELQKAMIKKFKNKEGKRGNWGGD